MDNAECEGGVFQVPLLCLLFNKGKRNFILSTVYEAYSPAGANMRYKFHIYVNTIRSPGKGFLSGKTRTMITSGALNFFLVLFMPQDFFHVHSVISLKHCVRCLVCNSSVFIQTLSQHDSSLLMQSLNIKFILKLFLYIFYKEYAEES